MKRRSNTQQRAAKGPRRLSETLGPVADEPMRQHRGAAPRFERNLKPRNEAQGELIAAIEAATVVFAVGPAGTGKTFVAVSKMVELLQAGRVDRLVFTRPAIEASGERLGFLPGDLMAKIDPYLRPIYDALYARMDFQTVNRMLETRQIEIAPLAFMRGRTFTNCAILVDEAQNATRGQLKMALTRIGERTKMILTGDPDPDQIDIEPEDSGLASVSAALGGAPGIETVTLGKGDIVRSRIVCEVLERI